VLAAGDERHWRRAVFVPHAQHLACHQPNAMQRTFLRTCLLPCFHLTLCPTPAHQHHQVPIPAALSDEAACRGFANPVPVIGMMGGLQAPQGAWGVCHPKGGWLGGGWGTQTVA
jgi:hypothetical protein